MSGEGKRKDVLKSNVLSGLAVGALQSALFNPWDRALYLSVKDKRPFLHKENWINPWQGWMQTAVQRTVSGGLYFMLQGICDDAISHHLPVQLSAGTHALFVGIGAGSLNGMMLNPLAAVKYHSWAMGSSYSFASSLKHALQLGGPQILFKGMVATVTRDTIFGISYEVGRHHLSRLMTPSKTNDFFCNLSAAILVLATLLSAFFRTHALLQMVGTVIGVRNSLMGSLYNKATKLSSKALATVDGATITNLMSADSNQIVQVGRWLCIGFIAPADIIGVFIFLGFVVGPYACVLLGVFMFSLPINGIIAGLFFSSKTKLSPLADARLRSSSEFIKYIRAIKYYAWELFFLDRIETKRGEEMQMAKKVNNYRSLLLQVSQAIGSVGLLFVLFSYVLGGNLLTPAKVFTVFRLVQMLRMPFIMLPVAISSILSLMNSFHRIENFLRLPELQGSLIDRSGPKGVVSITNGQLSWGDAKTLHDIDIKFSTGKLNMIIGQVGSGKTSILRLWENAKKEKSTIVYLQQRLRIGWGTARVATGMASAQLVFAHIKEYLAKMSSEN